MLGNQSGVFYSDIQDKQILICFVERDHLRKEVAVYNEAIDVMLSTLSLYEEQIRTDSIMLEANDNIIGAHGIQHSIMVERITLMEDANRSLIKELQLSEDRNKRHRQRNTVIYSVGTTIIVGILAALVIKSVL